MFWNICSDNRSFAFNTQGKWMTAASTERVITLPAGITNHEGRQCWMNAGLQIIIASPVMRNAIINMDREEGYGERA